MSFELSRSSSRTNAKLVIGAAPDPTWHFRSDPAQSVATVSRDESVTVYASQDAMRFGPRYYDENETAIIRAAVAERQDLPAPPLPLD
jgi:hypothetical protein